jgi:ATP-dependent DNA helicase RecQ
VLLEYFGDSCGACGNCDTCLAPPVTFDGTVAAQKALSCAYRTGQRFGVGYLIDVLLGKKDERIQRFGHDQVSTFGIGAEFKETEWQSVFRQLVALNYLTAEGSEFGGLRMTEQGQAFLRNKETLQLRRFAGKVKAARDRERSALERTREALTFTDESEKELFTALKELRLELAREQNVAPYIIFHDRTLKELAVKKPLTQAAMSVISGVGEKKMERYGDAFLHAIREFAGRT